MVSENSALLKEIGEGRRALKQVQHSLQRERDQAKALQLEYEQFRHQVAPSTRLMSSVLPCVGLVPVTWDPGLLMVACPNASYL